MVVVAVASVRSSSSSELARCSAPRLPTAETSARRKVTVSIPERTLPTAITPRHRPKTAGNASTCGTEVTRTIRMTHSMKRTAREVVGGLQQQWLILVFGSAGRKRRGPDRHSRRVPSQAQAWAWRDQPKGWRRRRLNAQSRSLPSSQVEPTRNATCARAPEGYTHQSDVEATA